MRRPDVLIIKSDQHNARCLGVNGHRQVRTPHLDALARGGVNFTRAFVQNPICTPSRMCYLSGQYPHNHGIFGLTGNERVAGGLPSLFSVFRAAGYRTGIVGHIHVAADWLQPHCDQYRDLHDESHPDDTPYDRYLKAKGLLSLRDDEAYRGRSQILDACPSELAFEDSHEGFCGNSLFDFLADQPADQPFLYQLDPLHPHQNYLPARQFWERYDRVKLELPPSADEDLATKPPHQRRMIERHRNYDWVFEPKTYQAGRLRKLQGYYGCISQVDHLVGLALQRLRELGRADNTIVVYCSDHGDFALEHGFLEKAPGISYDAITRVPFIWSWPAGGLAAGAAVEELVESIDLFPTLCRLAGLDAPDTLDGCDLSPLLRGGGGALRAFAVTEFPLSRTIRTKEWKLCHRPRGMFAPGDDDGELYHVAADPWEMTNLYHEPRHRDTRDELRRTLLDWTQLTSRQAVTARPRPPGCARCWTPSRPTTSDAAEHSPCSPPAAAAATDFRPRIVASGCARG